MTDKNTAEALHDKATRGGSLSAAEQAKLDAWYQLQDAAETAQIASSRPASPNLESLNAKVSAALTRLNEATLRLQAQSDENERLRQENAALSRRLTL